MGKILIIKLKNSSFEEYYANNFAKYNVDVCDLQELITSEYKEGLLDFPMYNRVSRYANTKKWKQYECIIVFDAVYLIPAVAHATDYKSKIVLWMWNTIEDYDVKRINIAKEFANIWTFDKADAEKYNLHFHEQFYFYQKNNDIKNTNKSVFFVGADKNRMSYVTSLSYEFSKIRFKSDFYVLPDWDKKYVENEQVFLIKDRLGYYDVLEKVKKCSAVLDLVKEGQVGLTVRALEAVFYNKKLITNNVLLKSTDLYDYGNIYVIGHEKESMECFLNKAFTIYPEFILEKYSVKNWLEDLCGREGFIVDNGTNRQYAHNCTFA